MPAPSSTERGHVVVAAVLEAVCRLRRVQRRAGRLAVGGRRRERPAGRIELACVGPRVVRHAAGLVADLSGHGPDAAAAQGIGAGGARHVDRRQRTRHVRNAHPCRGREELPARNRHRRVGFRRRMVGAHQDPRRRRVDDLRDRHLQPDVLGPVRRLRAPYPNRTQRRFDRPRRGSRLLLPVQLRRLDFGHRHGRSDRTRSQHRRGRAVAVPPQRWRARLPDRYVVLRLP